MILLAWLGCRELDEPDEDTDPYGITPNGIDCDEQAGTADQHTTPELDELLEAFEQSSGIPWTATMSCTDGVERAVTWSYIAPDRSEIYVGVRVTEDYEDPDHACELAETYAEVEIGGDTISYAGMLKIRLGTPSQEPFVLAGYDDPSGINANYIQDPPAGPTINLGTTDHSRPDDFYCVDFPLTPE